ncbi:MAG: hypothetical protein ACKVTZ_12285 [Bacteroidia bacterium]
MKKSLLFLSFFVFFSGVLFAQPQCCQNTLEKGKNLYNACEFEAAKVKFDAMKSGCTGCESEAQGWINKANKCLKNPNAEGCPCAANAGKQEFTEKQKRFLSKEEAFIYVAEPAVFETETLQILVQPEGRVGDVYEWNEEKKETLKEETYRIEVIPPVFETVQEQYLYKPAGKTPAIYKTRTWQRLKTPATTKKIKIPAEYMTVKIPVKVKSGTGASRPGEYKTVTRQVLKTPPIVSKETLPAEYETLTVYE